MKRVSSSPEVPEIEPQSEENLKFIQDFILVEEYLNNPEVRKVLRSV